MKRTAIIFDHNRNYFYVNRIASLCRDLVYTVFGLQWFTLHRLWYSSFNLSCSMTAYIPVITKHWGVWRSYEITHPPTGCKPMASGSGLLLSTPGPCVNYVLLHNNYVYFTHGWNSLKLKNLKINRGSTGSPVGAHY